MSSDRNDDSDLGGLAGAGKEMLLPLFVPAQAGRQVAERGEEVGGRTLRFEGAERRFDPSEVLAKPEVLANQLAEFGLEVGTQPVQRREMDLLLEREMRVERRLEALQRLLHLGAVTAFEPAQRRLFERVEVAMLARDATRLVDEAEAKSRLVALRHDVRNSIAAQLRCRASGYFLSGYSRDTQ